MTATGRPGSHGGQRDPRPEQADAIEDQARPQGDPEVPGCDSGPAGRLAWSLRELWRLARPRTERRDG